MSRIRVKRVEFNFNPIRDSYNRRSQLFKNNIIESLRKVGLTEDDVEIRLEANCRIRAPGIAEWYMDGHRLYFSYKTYLKYAENLYVVSKVVDIYANKLANKEITLEEFTRLFSEEDSIEKDRKEAREIIGVNEDCLDLNEINKKFKLLSMKYHPDRPEGNLEMFQKINKAHKTLKRELE